MTLIILKYMVIHPSWYIWICKISTQHLGEELIQYQGLTVPCTSSIDYSVEFNFFSGLRLLGILYIQFLIKVLIFVLHS